MKNSNRFFSVKLTFKESGQVFSMTPDQPDQFALKAFCSFETDKRKSWYLNNLIKQTRWSYDLYDDN